MSRYYLSRRIGTGIPGAEDPYRCESMDWLNRNFSGQQNSPSGFVGHVWGWTLRPYELTPEAHTALLAALPNTYALPDLPLTTRFLEMPPAVTNELVSKLDTSGFDMTWTTPATTLGDVVSYVLLSCQIAEWVNIQIGDKTFDVRRKTMGDLLPGQRSEIENRAAFFGASMNGIGQGSSLEQVTQRFKAVRARDGKPPIQETVVRSDGNRIR